MTERPGQSKLIFPFHDRASFEEVGFKVARGEGAYLIDEQGNHIFDSISGMWNVPLGYSNNAIAEAMIEQLRRLPASSLIVNTHEAAERLADALVELTSTIDVGAVFLTSGGSEAVESAIKISRHAFHVTGQPHKQHILSADRSYHGMTFGALSASGIEEDKRQFGAMLPAMHQVASPLDLLREGGEEKFYNDFLQAVERLDPRNVAAVILEPVYAVAGMIAVSPSLLRKLRDLCTAANIHLIVDEVTTGMWRAGDTPLACQAAGIAPDILAMAKALTNGYAPMGATLINKNLVDLVDRPDEPFMHGHTFSGNPLACAAGLAAVGQMSDMFADETSTGATLTDHLAKSIHQHFTDNPAVLAWRLTGRMLGVDLNIPENSACARAIRLECRKRGVIVRPTYRGRTFNFLPMYISGAEEVSNMVRVFAEVVERRVES